MLIISSCQHNRRAENLTLFVTAVREREKYWKRVKKKKRKRAWKGEREVAMWDHLYSESRIKIPHHSILLFFFFFSWFCYLTLFLTFSFVYWFSDRFLFLSLPPSLSLSLSISLFFFFPYDWTTKHEMRVLFFFFFNSFFVFFFFLVLLLLKTVAAVLLKILQFSTFNFFALLVLQKMENDANETCLLGVVPVPWYPLPIKKIKAMVQKQLKQIGSGKPETAACN